MERISSATNIYELGRTAGNGSFGIVCEASCVMSKEKVAIKKVLQDSRYKNRELSIMKQLYHPNIVQLKDYFFTEAKSTDEDVPQRYLSLVMEYLPQTIHQTLKKYNRIGDTKHSMPFPYIQVYAYQMLRSIGYLHSLGISHRDIKPQNLLVNPETHEVKLCDFGSAKRLYPGEPSVSYICSRFYRAPELMLGASEYTCAIDIWSMGCVIAEMIIGRPFFAGATSVDQLVHIIEVLGSPSLKEVAAMNKNYRSFQFPSFPPKNLRDVIINNGNLPDSIYVLLEKMLRFIPETRMKPYDALALELFDDLRKKNYRLPDNKVPVSLFNFSEHELNQMSEETKRKLIPSWLLNNESKII